MIKNSEYNKSFRKIHKVDCDRRNNNVEEVNATFDIFLVGKIMKDLLGKRIAPDLKKIIDKMTAENRDDRYQSAEEAIKALERYQLIVRLSEIINNSDN